jgi:hypothetical protein
MLDELERASAQNRSQDFFSVGLTQERGAMDVNHIRHRLVIVATRLVAEPHVCRGMVTRLQSVLLGLCSLASASSFAQSAGVFPEFAPYWESTASSPFVASSVDLKTRPQGTVNPTVDHVTITTPSMPVQAARSIGGASTEARAKTELGAHHTYASSSISQGDTATASAISLWRDLFTLSGSGNVTFGMTVDGSLPLPAVAHNTVYGYAATELFFEIYSVLTGAKRLQGHLTVAQYYDDAIWEWASIAPNGGWLGGDSVQLARTGGTDVYDLALNGILEAGQYEIRSQLWSTTSPGTFATAVTADFFNTATLDFVGLDPGMSLTSASGQLFERTPGEYGYAITQQVVSEPATVALASVALLGLVAGKRRLRA